MNAMTENEQTRDPAQVDGEAPAYAAQPASVSGTSSEAAPAMRGRCPMMR